MNALDYLRTLLKPAPNPLFHDVLTIVSQDEHVRRTGLYPHVTSSSLYRLIDAMWQGMDFAAVKWGCIAIPHELVFACDVTEGGETPTFNRMLIGNRRPADDPILYITNAFAAQAMQYGRCGDMIRFDHMPDTIPNLPAFHVMALQTIEECLHAKQYRLGMRPQTRSTLGNRNDPLEQEAHRLMPEIIREFGFKETIDH